jgi:hypothetical protein
VAVTRISALVAAFALITLSALLETPNAQALPVEPDIKKLAEEAQQPQPAFIPSRVGWNGPEMIVKGSERDRWEAAIGPVLAAEQQRRFRNTLREVFVPEPQAVAAIIVIIFLLRRLRSLREQQQAVLTQQPQAA